MRNKKNKRSNLMRNKNRFQEHCQSDHNEICDWAFTIIDQAKTEIFLKKNELYWYHKLKTYTSLGLTNVMLTLYIKEYSLFIFSI